MRRRSFIAGLSAVPLALKVNTLHACSLVFVNDRKIAKIVVRSMDLPVSFPERPKLFVFPRGMARTSTSGVVPGIRARIEGIGSNTVH
jgi:penicillin V acylase-like amidase (Ntn superfamily)